MEKMKEVKKRSSIFRNAVQNVIQQIRNPQIALQAKIKEDEKN